MDKRQRAVAASIAGEVRRGREGRGWSQAELAERVDLSTNYVSLLERAERLPSVEVLVRIAQTLGTPVGTLVGEPAPEKDAWLAETLSLLRTIPESARVLTLAVLRAITSSASSPSGADQEASPRRKSGKR